MDARTITQKYEEIRRSRSVTGYDAELKKVIIQQGMVSFALHPNPRVTQEPICKESSSYFFPEQGKGSIVELLSTIISNIVVNRAAV